MVLVTGFSDKIEGDEEQGGINHNCVDEYVGGNIRCGPMGEAEQQKGDHYWEYIYRLPNNQRTYWNISDL